MKSKIMSKRKELVDNLGTGYNIYSTNILKDITYPAIVFFPTNQVPNIDLASYSNRILEYQWSLIVIDRLDNYYDTEEAQDELWYLVENIPKKMGVKITESIPFGHVKDNNELVCIELKCSSEI